MRSRTSVLILAATLLALPTLASAEDAPPVRAQRKLMIGAELGWNSLAGVGLNASYHLLPRLSVDAGLGYSLVGAKLGARARFNLLTSEWTPFIAAGFLYGFGQGNRDLNLPVGSQTVVLRVAGSPFAQFVAGVDYSDAGGFTFLFTAGYAVLLRENLTYSAGQDNALATQTLNPLFHSGLVVAAALGYSF